MNARRRRELNKAIELMAQARAIIEEMQEQEQESFDNMPEGLQYSELGQKIEENAYGLGEIVGYLEEQEEALDEIING